MAHVSSTTIVDATGLDRLRQCRRDIVDERSTLIEASSAYRALRAVETYFRQRRLVPARRRFAVDNASTKWSLPLWGSSRAPARPIAQSRPPAHRGGPNPPPDHAPRP